jgi:hypothetical protein
MKRIVIHPDAQVPFQDKRVVRNFLKFLKDYRPHELASVGDEVDFPQISRWSRGIEGEYKGDLQEHVDAGVAYLSALRDAVGGVPFHVSRSNHMDRPLNYVRKYAPGLMGLKALTIPSLLEFDRLGITYHEKPYELAPGWFMMHGDESGISQKPGETALKLANKIGYSVVCGHTHRAGLVNNAQAVNGVSSRVLWGFEVGNFMDLKKADYTRGIANWQHSFGILYVDERRRVTPSLIPIQANGSFVVEGAQYG